MSEKIEYRQRVAFINREKEKRYLDMYINERPEEILFLYRPELSDIRTHYYTDF